MKNQTETMTLLEQEIRDTALQLVREQRDQQRDNMKALLQVRLFPFSKTNERIKKEVKHSCACLLK
jgi:hypothetical protein